MSDAEAIERKRQQLLMLRIRERHAGTATADQIPVAPRGGRLPLSRLQAGIWLAVQLAPQVPTYNLPVTVRLRGPLDVAAIADALRALTARHESLRTRFGCEGGRPYLEIAEPPGEIWLEVTDLRDLPADQRWPHAIRLAKAHVGRPFDLGHAPLLRTWLARIGPDDHLLQLNAHHSVCDGWSLAILTRELGKLYTAAVVQDRPMALPAAPLQPADVTQWQLARQAAGALGRQLAYWRQQLAGLRPLEFPSDRPRPASPTWAGQNAWTELAPALPDKVRSLAGRAGASAFAVYIAAFAALLHAMTGQSDIAIGTVASGRTRSELENVVGLLANLLVLRIRLGAELSFSELIGHCQEVIIAAQAAQDVPFTDVVAELAPDRTAAANPLFQICLTHATPDVNGDLSGLAGLAAEPVQIGQDSARFDLIFQVTEQPGGGFGVVAEYSTELFNPGRIEWLATGFASVLDAAMANPAGPISSLCAAADAGHGPPQGGAASDAEQQAEPPDPQDMAAVRSVLRDIWQEIFGIPAGKLDDDASFFTIGGTSLQAVQLMSRISERLGVAIDLTALYAEGSVTELAALVGEAFGMPPEGTDGAAPKSGEQG